MKALVKKHAEPGLWMEELPVPVPRARELLVRVHKTSICGTDLHIYKWDDWAKRTLTLPLTIGHEFVGEVVEVGSEARGWRTGELVSGEGHITCGMCRNCHTGKRHLCINCLGVGIHRDGCFAEYVTIPDENLYRVSPTLDQDIASLFDPLGNAVHTACSFDLLGEDVLVTGAGPIGLMGAAIAKHAGARRIVITDRNPYRLDLARTIPGVTPVNIETQELPSVMSDLQIREGFDVGMEMSGSPHALSNLLETVKPGGNIALLGILPNKTVIDWDLVIFKGLTLKGIYGREIFDTWYKADHMLQSGLDIDFVITHRMSHTKFKEGFEVMLAGASGKVVLDWLA